MAVMLEWVKMYRRFATSSIMECSVASRYFFQMAVLLSDSRGVLIGTIPALARQFNMDDDLVRVCLDELGQPDKSSTHDQYDGRRIVKTGENEYLVTTKLDYNPDPTNAQRQRAFRTRKRQNRNDVTVAPVTVTPEESRVEESREDKKNIRRSAPFVPPTLDDVRKHAEGMGWTDFDSEGFHAHFETRNWVPKGYTRQMTSWKAAMVTWRKNQGAFAGGKASPQQAPATVPGVRFTKDGQPTYKGEFYTEHAPGRWYTDDGTRPDGTNKMSDPKDKGLNQSVWAAMSRTKEA